MNLLRVFILLTFVFSFFEIQAKTTTAIANGNWTTAGTWDNGVPAAGDVIIIPSGITVVVNSTVNLRSAATTTLTISGTLSFSSLGTIRLNNGDGDAINVQTGGSIIAGDLLGGFITFGNAPFYTPSFSISSLGVTQFPTFAFTPGPITGPSTITGGVLPVTLISFNAVVINDHVELTWVTASELNNDFFTIERSFDAEIFDELFTTKGQGTTNLETSYIEQDYYPILGRSYYRLKQTDYDGGVTFSDVVRVDFDNVPLSMKVYANPVKDKFVTVEIHGLEMYQEVPVSILNIQGQLVYEGLVKANQTGMVMEKLAVDQPAGIYILKAGRTQEFIHKIVVE